MKVGVVGLGLIGGSMAKAVKKKTEHTVLGWDVSETIRYSALLMEAVHGFMEDGNPKDCDLVLLGLYPHLTVLRPCDLPCSPAFLPAGFPSPA